MSLAVAPPVVAPVLAVAPPIAAAATPAMGGAGGVSGLTFSEFHDAYSACEASGR